MKVFKVEETEGGLLLGVALDWRENTAGIGKELLVALNEYHNRAGSPRDN